MAARTGERCYWWCSQGLQVIQLHMVQNPTMYILSNYTINWHTTPYQCHITCYTGGYQSNCVVVGVAARVAETLNKKSHQGDAMGGQKPTSNSDATNNNCQTIIFLVGDHFSERKFIVECLCFLYRFMFMVDMRRCGKPQMNEWFKEIDGLGYFHRVKLINSGTSSKNLLIEPLIS